MTSKKSSGLVLAEAPQILDWPPASLINVADPQYKWARTVMFDLHGVIFDWESAFMTFAQSHFGYTFNSATRQFYDIGRDPSTPLSHKQFDDLFTQFARRSHGGYGELEPIPGVIEQIELIASAGIKPIICTWTPGANDLRPDGSTTFQTGIAQVVTDELIARHLGHVIPRQNVLYSSTSGKKHIMLAERIPLIVEDKTTTAVDVAESALAAILMPYPYNQITFRNILRLDATNQLASAVLNLFEGLDSAGVLAKS